MDLQAAREIKNRLLTDTRALASGPATTFAVGIAPRPDGSYAIAVRLRDDADRPPALDRLAAETPGELDVRTVGEIRALSAPAPEQLQQRNRPLYPGVSIGHPDVTAGTLGAVVHVDGTPHLLSNSHVLANSGLAQIGDAALQPAVADGGTTVSDRVGTLAVITPLDADRVNVVDAALASLDPGVEADGGTYPGGPLTGVRRDASGDPAVAKIGRTTGFTTGRITAFEVDGITVGYDVGTRSFDDQIEIEGDGDLGFSDGGDSGSVIFGVVDRQAVGLLFAGSTQGASNGRGLTYANPLATVLETLGATWPPPPAADPDRTS